LKETHYYFSHDCNARRDPKIAKMLLDYGMKGYGWYWVLLEMMREQGNFKLNIGDKSDIAVIAIQTRSTPNKIEKFMNDCCQKYKLFKKNKKYLWSKTFLNRMKKMRERQEKARNSAKIRWSGVCENDANASANAMQTQCERNANKIKENKIKRKENIKRKEKEFASLISEVVSYLNQKSGKRFRLNNKSAVKHITARLNEGYTIDDLKHVIDVKCQDWKGRKTIDGRDLSIYLRPETLFGTAKFESYLNQKLDNPPTEEELPPVLN